MTGHDTTAQRDPRLASSAAPEVPAPANLPHRPNYHPEEGEVGRSDYWHVVKAALVVIAIVMALSWLLMSLR